MTAKFWRNVYKILFLYSVSITCKMDRNNFKSRLHIPCTCTGICVYVTVLRSKQDVYWQLLFLSIFNLPHVNIHSPMTGNRDPKKNRTAKWSVRSITPADSVSAGTRSDRASIRTTFCLVDPCSLCGSTLVTDHTHLVRLLKLLSNHMTPSI